MTHSKDKNMTQFKLPMAHTRTIERAYLESRKSLEIAIDTYIAARYCLADIYARTQHPGMDLPPLVKYLFDKGTTSELLFPEPESPAAQEMDTGFQAYLHELHKRETA